MVKVVSRRVWFAVAPFGPFLFACVSTGVPIPPVYRLSEVDSPPRLIQCAEADPSVAPAETADNLRVSFTVQPNGMVAPGSVRIVNQPSTALRENVERAQQLAPTCRYEPGFVDGRPVAVRIQRVVRFSRR